MNPGPPPSLPSRGLRVKSPPLYLAELRALFSWIRSSPRCVEPISLDGRALVEVVPLLEIAEGIYAVADLPVLYVPRFRTLIVADIHLGFEEEMSSKGIYLPRVQLKKACEIVERAASITRANTLIVAGDLKHKFEKLGRREAKDVREFVEFATKIFDRIVLVRGNHDTFVYWLRRKYGIEIYDKLWLGDILVVHGHRELDPYDNPKIVVLGHEHPSITLRDVLGSLSKVPCFLVTPLRRGCIAVVLPACGVYQSGTPVTTMRETYLSPILRMEAVLEEAQPFALIEGEGLFALPRLKDLEEVLKGFEYLI